ncbi:MAG TPA: hypothetical protein VEK78_00175 [Gemmatimonadales bacterium]|nr:hypothetical protein [Gemmatimonadales bacterium]
MTRIAHPGALFIAIGLLALGLGPATGPSMQSVRLPFAATFDGVSNAGSAWAGQVRGQPGGRVRVTLHQVESPLEAARPVWHVQARWTVETGSAMGSFTGDLEGMVDWKTGATRLGGVVTSGWMKGAWVQQTGRFVNGDLSGILEITPSVAGR